MTNLTIFAIAFLSCVFFFIMGRMSVINDINRKLRSFKTEKFPIIKMGNLYCALRTIISDYDFSCNAFCKVNESSTILGNENKQLQAKYDKMIDDYKEILNQLESRRQACSHLEKRLNNMREEKDDCQYKINEQRKLFNGFISQVYENAEMIANTAQIVYEEMSNLSPLIPTESLGIYATKLKNKSIHLSIGTIKVDGNGKISYHERGRSLGLLTSKDNKWAQDLSINTDMAIGQPYLISAIYPNSFISRMGDIQSKLHDIQGDACKMKSHISDNKNLLL